MLRKLRIKFVCINMLLVTIMLTVIFGLVYSSTKSNLEQQSIQWMEELADDPYHAAKPGDYEENAQLPYFVLQLNRSGNLVAVSGGYYELNDEDFLTDVMQKAINTGYRTGVLSEYNLRFCREINLTNQRIVFVDMSYEKATLKALVETSALLGALSIAMFLGISLLLSYWAMKPVERAWKQQRQFVADASHELKTPLTVVMANAQMLSQPEFSDEQRQQFTASIQTMSQQMRGLVEDMLELARADSGESREDFKELDFSRLVSDCVLPFEPVMFEKELAFDYQIEDGIILKGREQQLRQLTDILLDNAAKYSLAGGPVSLKLKHLGGRHCQLTVSNPAPEMSREECRDIFKRFYRADKARSRDGSYGLGLSIAESIVKAHGGKISCEYNQGVICFILQLVIER
jgi:signal transduction histidine kinase